MSKSRLNFLCSQKTPRTREDLTLSIDRQSIALLIEVNSETGVAAQFDHRFVLRLPRLVHDPLPVGAERGEGLDFQAPTAIDIELLRGIRRDRKSVV